MPQSVNTFNELNSDSHPLNTKNNVMTDALNAALTTRGENQLILQNLKGTDLITSLTAGFKPLAVEVYKNIAYIVSGRFDSNGVFLEGEIGTYPSPDYDALFAQPQIDSEYFVPLKNEYQPLKNFIPNSQIPVGIPPNALEQLLNDDRNYFHSFTTSLFNFKKDNLIEIEVQPSYDDSVNIIITDDKNPMRLINSRFKLGENEKTAALAERRQSKDTNTYSEQRFLATNHIRNYSIIPNLEFLGVKVGGNLPGGGYKFYFKYVDSDGSLSDVVEESRLVAVAYDDHGAKPTENTGKYIEFQLTNLDYKFSGLKVYYSYVTGEIEPVTINKEILDTYDFPDNGILNFRLYGTELTTDINKDRLNLDYSALDKIKTITQKDDRLVVANITSNNDNLEKFRELAQLITIEEANRDLVIKGLGQGYADPFNVYNYVGVWSGETYELAVCFVLSNGRGTTPALSIRGLDNYNGNATYSFNPANINFNNNSFLITEADGFLTNSPVGENRLGVYRTSKNKTLLKGVNKDTTDVKYLKLNLEAFFNQDPANPYKTLVDNEIEGLFIVRKERKKDCVVQGYFTNTARVNIYQNWQENNPFYYQVNQSLADLHSKGALQSLRNAIGKGGTLDQVFDSNSKIIPAPGRIMELTVEDRCFQTSSLGVTTTAKNPISISMQGVVVPDPLITSVNGQNIDLNYAFYCNDALASPAYFASMFNNSKKSVLLNSTNQAIKMRQIINSASTFSYVGGSSTYPISYTGGGSVNLLNAVPPPPATSDTYINFLGTNTGIALVEAQPNIGQTKGIISGTLQFKYYDTTLTPDWGYYNGISFSPQNFNLNITVDELGVLTATMPIASYVWNTNIYRYELSLTAPATGTWDHMDGGNTLSGSFSLSLPLRVERYTISTNTLESSDTRTLSFTGSYSNLSYSISSGNEYSITNIDNSQTPLKVLEADNFLFNPNLIPSELTGQYISEKIDAFTGSNFSCVSSRNAYWYLPRTGNLPQNAIGENYNNVLQGGNWRFLGVDSTRYADYVGMRLKNAPLELKLPLANDTGNVNQSDPLKKGAMVSNFVNFPSNDFGITGTDNGDWTFRVQHQGIRFAVLGNIYDSLNGAIDFINWKNKYINTNFAENYFSITKRFTIAELKSNFFNILTPEKYLETFSGDCYINYTYKRAFYNVGIDEAPTATDPSLYKEGEKSAGLYPKGFVFPLVMESNANTALRTFEFKDLIESGLYGKERSFYPIDNIDSLRSSRQLESKGVNNGYNYNNSEKRIAALNDRSPALNINYDTRVLVSEVAVSGSFTNGYTNFSGFNFRDYNKHLGAITKIIAHNNELYCIQERGISKILMNQKTMISPEQGGVFIDNAQLLDPKLQPISTEYGSTQQFSIVKTDNAIYGCDLNKNKIWKVSQNGLELISDFAVQNVLNLFRKNLEFNNTKNFVKGNYDRSANNVIFNYYNVDANNYTSGLFELIIPENNPQNQYYAFSPTTGGVYFNETLGKWVSKISWNPLFMFEINNDIFSFSTDDGRLWKHYSENAPYCYIYDKQHKFELEFVLLENSSVQKVLDNLLVISNRSFPGRATYTIDTDINYETFALKNNSYIELLRQRHEEFNLQNLNTLFVNNNLYIDLNFLSKEEIERLKGASFVYANTTYILGDYFTQNNINYIEILDENLNIIQSNIPSLIISKLEFGIIKQNMEYIEDHLYIEVGKSNNSSLIRDKAIKVKLTYEGMNYTVIQSIISLFQYSYS